MVRNIFSYFTGFFRITYFTLEEVALLDFSDTESLLESDSDLESEELSSDEADPVSEELDVLLSLEIAFPFFFMSSDSLCIGKKKIDM